MIIGFFILIFILALGTLLIPRLVTAYHASSRLYTVEDVPAKKVAIVFGAGLWRDGSPTPVLRDRVATAAELYFSGVVEKLLMSGDNSEVNYDEPGAMRSYALSLGVPEEAIILDYAGRRTYDTCYRARDIFNVNDAILVTQKFHLPRAIYTCLKLGITANGVPADRRIYRNGSLAFWNTRELPATVVAFWQLNVSQPEPILGDPEPIYPLEVQ
ncbi:MAG: ElyC/SanA/YdcF family protein [Anaerolineales bacterium]|jgi:SanA protein